MLNKTKKIAAIIFVVAVTGSLCACGGGTPAETSAAAGAVTEAVTEAPAEASSEVTEATETSTETSTESTEPAIVGGWEHVAATGSLLTDEEKEICQKGYTDEVFVYDTIVPIAVLAKQVVAGTNYAVLSEDTYKNGPTWEIDVLHEDLQGNVKLLSQALINTDEVFTAKNAGSEPVLGGFTCTAPVVESNVLPEAAKNAPVTLTPIQQLAKQVVSGTNAMWLCRGEDKDGNAGLYVAVFYEDLQGNSSLTSCEKLDLNAYTEIAFRESETLAEEVTQETASADDPAAMLTANSWMKKDDGKEEYYIFNDDLTGKKIDEDTEGFTYEISGNTVTITENDGDVDSYTFSFKKDGNDTYLVLTEADGDSDSYLAVNK